MKSPTSLPTDHRFALAGLIGALGAGALLTAAPGCNYVGAAYVILHGPEKIPAKFKLDPKRKTVILIDDLSNRVPKRSLRDQIGKSADQTLLENDVIAQGFLISADSARRAAASDSVENRMSVVDVGRRLGAEVIIHVTMTGWTLHREPGVISPAATAEIKVIDCVANDRIWPPGEGGYEFRAEMPRKGGDLEANASQADKAKWDADLARYVGTEIARLFFEHEKDSLRQQEGTDTRL